jgi:hypothetical protein
MDQWGMDNSVKKETHMLKHPCHFPSCHKWILKIAEEDILVTTTH